MDLDSLIRILQVALGIGLVIFVHELGHFVAARICKVKVDVFSIGMGPRLVSWVRNATRYQIALVPIGGYVRMAGEERRLDGEPPRPGDLASKSVGQRFFIYSGGVLMNVVFGLVVFPVIFYVGVPLTPPVLGEPIPGGAAWQAEIEGGTEVLAVDGKEVFDYLHVATAIALGDGPVELTLRERDGAERTQTVHPRFDERDGLRSLDAYADLMRGPRGGYRLTVEPDSPLAAAGAATGDELLGVVGGAPGLDLQQQVLLAADGSPLELVIGPADGSEPRTVRVEPVAVEGARPRIGIFPPAHRVAATRGDARGLGLEPGDRIESVGGRPLRKAGDFAAALLAALEDGAPASVPYRLDRGGSTRTGSIEVRSREHALALADDLALETDVETTRILVNPGEPAALAGVRDGDVLRRVAGGRVERWADTHELIQDAIAKNVEAIELVVARTTERGSETRTLSVAPALLPSYEYGVRLEQASYVYRAGGIGEAVGAGVTSSVRFAQEIFLTLKSWMTRDVDFKKSAGGPIAIAAISYTFAEGGWTKLCFFLCMLSINLAIVNVLPIPLLDGGHLAFLVIEKIKGSPVSERILVYSQVVGLVLILSLLVFITYNDLVRWVLPPG